MVAHMTLKTLLLSNPRRKQISVLVPPFTIIYMSRVIWSIWYWTLKRGHLLAFHLKRETKERKKKSH